MLTRAARILGPHRSLQGDLARRRLATLRRLGREITELERRFRTLVRPRRRPSPTLLASDRWGRP
jgi:hypothetical protein